MAEEGKPEKTEPGAPEKVFQPSFFDKQYVCKRCRVKTQDWVIRYDAEYCLCRKCSREE
jgi:hypothetical protein